MDKELIKRLRGNPTCEQSEITNHLFDWCGEAADALEAADRRIKELEAQLGECRKDAERYRWLRDNAPLNYPAGGIYDDAIDGAIKRGVK